MTNTPTIDPNDEVPLRLAHMETLRSAWGVLAPVGLSARGDEIAASGRALTEYLTKIQSTKSDITQDALAGTDNLLAEFETTIRQVALEVPIAQLRSVLPSFRDSDRQGLLDLLDVLVGEDPTGASSVTERIGVIDYLITLLCTRRQASAGVVSFDPATLTERMSNLCASADEADDALLAEVEAEFFAAATMEGEALRQELQQRTLRGRKVQLGMNYFATRVLRAIVTYNAALLGRVADEIIDSGEWGNFGTHAGRTANAESLFESEPLRNIADAVRRRANGEERQPTPADGIAWGLDFDYLEAAERKSLRSQQLATAEDPLGTAILIGLLSRSLAVLSIELQELGLSPDLISDTWVDELNGLFQQEINEHISNDAYKLACALSELKNKFLLAPLAEQNRILRAAPPIEATTTTEDSAPPEEDEEEWPERTESVRDLVRHALDQNSESARAESRPGVFDLPWARIGQRLALAAAIATIGYFALTRDNHGLESMPAEQLARFSPYLAEGQRNREGLGTSFVGALDDAWLEFPLEQREAMAEELVETLRLHGMRQIMIYDAHHRVRIQAMGSQPTRVL